MITCPDKRTKNWKQLVKAVGEPTAYAVWNAKEGLVEDYLNSLSQPTAQPQAGQPSDVEAKKADIERRRQEELEKPYKTLNDGSGKMVTISTETTEKEGVKKTKFKTETTNRKGEARTQNDKGYNTFEEAAENLGIDLQSEENETALELVEALKESQGKETLPARVREIRESTDRSSPFFGMRTATIVVGNEKIDFRLKSDAELAALESGQTSDIKLSPTDKIIWGHPGLGKTTFKEQNPDKVLDFDTDFKPKVAQLLGLPKEKQNSQGLNEWRNDSNKEEYERVMREMWQKAVAEAKATNKMLVVSDMMFLKENSKDFDKIITTSKETFIERTTSRGDDVTNLESWKSNIDATISSVEQNKIISTNKYFSELAALEGTKPEDTEAKKKEIQDKIDALKKQLPTPKLVMPQQVSGRIGGIFNELRAVEKASSRTKAKKEEALYKKYGREAVDKARALDHKFQNIVKQLIEKKLNFFYDEETQERVKRCF